LSSLRATRRGIPYRKLRSNCAVTQTLTNIGGHRREKEKGPTTQPRGATNSVRPKSGRSNIKQTEPSQYDPAARKEKRTALQERATRRLVAERRYVLDNRATNKGDTTLWLRSLMTASPPTSNYAPLQRMEEEREKEKLGSRSVGNTQPRFNEACRGKRLPLKSAKRKPRFLAGNNANCDNPRASRSPDKISLTPVTEKR